MRRTTRMVAVAATLLLLAVGCTGGGEKHDPRPNLDAFTPPSLKPVAQLGAAEGALNLVAPPGYVEAGKTDPKVDWVTPFQTATGCQVNLTVADTPERTVELIRSGKYDGVAALGSVSLRLIADGDVAPVATSLVPNYASVVPGLRDKPWNSVDGTPYGVPHGRSATLLMWRTDLVKPAPASWSIVYQKASPYAGKVTAYDSPMTIADAALYLRTAAPGLRISDPYALTSAQLKAAVDLLRTQRALVRGYWRDYTQQVPAFKDGTVVVGSTTQAVADLTKAEKAPVQATVPGEGTTGDSATWMITARAKHPNCMYKWMDHILSPKVNAQAAEWLGIAPATAAACQATSDNKYCSAFHATDEGYWSRVSIWTTPMKDCRDGRGTKCTDYATWRKAWRNVVS